APVSPTLATLLPQISPRFVASGQWSRAPADHRPVVASGELSYTSPPHFARRLQFIMKAFPNAALLTLLYLVGATLWILFSNELRLGWLGTGDQHHHWQTLKSVGFVSFSGPLLYLVLRLQRGLLDDQLLIRRQHETRLRQSAAVFDT